MSSPSPARAATRSLAFALVVLVALVTGAGEAAAGRVLLRRDAWRRCRKRAAKLPAKSLRAVDWCNRDSAGSGPSLRAGRGEDETLPGPAENIYEIRSAVLQDVVYLDVNGDGEKEALVVVDRHDREVISDRPRASSEYSMIEVFTWKEGAPLFLGEIETSGAPVYAIAASIGRLTVRSGTKPRAPEALQRFELTAKGFLPR
jgi:hypothetical protein